MKATKEEKAYQIVGGNKWSIEKYFQPSEVIRAYNCDKFYQPQFYVVNGEVVKNIGQSDGKTHIYVITKIIDSYNEKEDRGEKVIEYYDNTTYKTVAIADDASISRQGIFTDVSGVEQLKKGDVIQIHTNVQSQIDLMTVYFRLSELDSKSMGMYYFSAEIDPDKMVYTPDVSSGMPDIGIVYGRVVDAEGNRVIVETSAGEEYPVSVGGSVYGNPYFIVYDTATSTSTPTGFSEIQPGDKGIRPTGW